MSSNPNSNPPQPTVPGLTLDGINGLAQFNQRSINSMPYDLNGSEQYFNYPELKKFLSTIINVPVLDPAKLVITPDPSVNIPDYQQAIFPPTPNTRLPTTNKVVLVVGGSRNLGKVISLFLSNQGYNTIATSRDPSSYFGPNRNPLLSNIPLDVRVQSSVDNFFKLVIKPLGRLDVLILCPGLHTTGPVQQYTADFFTNVLEVKSFGYNRCITAALPYLRLNPDGRVLSMSSIAGCEMYTNPFLGMYSISNHLVDSMMKQCNLDEYLLYSLGYITNKVTYITLEPEVILSTIGTFDYFDSRSLYPTELVNKSSHIIIGALQSGAGAGIGFPASDTSTLGQQIYDIISAPQPVFKYFLGDPNVLLAGQPLGDVIALTLQLSDLELYNTTVTPISGLLNAPVVNSLRDALKSIYVPSP